MKSQTIHLTTSLALTAAVFAAGSPALAVRATGTCGNGNAFSVYARDCTTARNAADSFCGNKGGVATFVCPDPAIINLVDCGSQTGGTLYNLEVTNPLANDNVCGFRLTPEDPNGCQVTSCSGPTDWTCSENGGGVAWSNPALDACVAPGENLPGFAFEVGADGCSFLLEVLDSGGQVVESETAEFVCSQAPTPVSTLNWGRVKSIYH